MEWKTDWTPADNHGRNQWADMRRVLNNLQQMAAQISQFYRPGFSIPTVATNGYDPFVSVLNGLEENLNALHLWPVPWESKVVTWQPVTPYPTFADVNRWERNGQALDQAIEYITNYSYQRVAKTFYAGSERTLQHFSRGR